MLYPFAKVISLAMLIALTGCTSMRITPDSEALAVADAVRGDELRQLVLVLDDAAAGKDDYSFNTFAEELRKAVIFKSVVSARNGQQGHVRLSKFRQENPAFEQGFLCFEPYLMVVTAGVIPAVCEGKHVLSFELTSVGGNEQMSVKEGFTQKSVTGWAAVPLHASSNWKNEGAYANFLARVFLSRKDAILEMGGFKPASQRAGASDRP